MRRVALVLAGLCTLIAAWFTGATEVLPGPFSRHMTVHMSVVAVAAPLITFGIAGTKLDPVRAAPQWFPPVPISVVELIVVWLWHAPVLHHFARHSTAGLVLEQGTFLLSGLLVWLSTFGGSREAREDRVGAGVVALLLTSMHMTLLGALLALPPRPLYAHHGHGSATIDALDDQHLGGAIMLLVGGIVYLFGGLWLTAQLLRRWTRPAAKAVMVTDGGSKAAGRS